AARAGTATDVIEIAEQQIGIEEGDGGQTKFHDWYVNSPAAKLTADRDGGNIDDYNGASWCNMFVSWVGEKANAKGIGADAWTVAHAKWFKDNDRLGQEAKPGSVVFFSWDGGGISSNEHVGFVVKDNGDGTITTIEGNTENAVKKKIRDKSDVTGYGYPDYVK
ncbi:CHAP domain-containing protein, partial [Actinomadura adrarensis]